jgi:hypothetical protein
MSDETEILDEREIAEAFAAASAQEREEWEAFTVGAKVPTADPAVSREVMIAELRATFDKYHKADHWKDAVNALVPPADVWVFCEAVAFYHGARPVASRIVGEPLYTVTGPGYVC